MERALQENKTPRLTSLARQSPVEHEGTARVMQPRVGAQVPQSVLTVAPRARTCDVRFGRERPVSTDHTPKLEAIAMVAVLSAT